MLRGLILAAGLVMVLGGVAATVTGAWVAALWLLTAGLVLTIGTAFERVFYKKVARHAPGAGWTRTAERFVDPDTGQTVDVYFHAASGERRYVKAGAPQPGAGRGA